MADTITLARPYAKAAFEYAVSHNDLTTWHTGLNALVIAYQNDLMQHVIDNPKVSASIINQILSDATKSYLNQHIKNFLQIILDYHRLSLLPEIFNLFTQYVAEREKTVDVTVTSAFPLSEVMQAKLTQALERHLKLGVFLQCHVDNSLIGGAIIRAGDFVIDGSVSTQLSRLSENLIS